MTILMIDAGPAAEDALLTRTGGVPLAPVGTVWPRCATCSGPMQFLAQIMLADLSRGVGGEAEQRGGVLVLFMCQNDPGMCDEWSPSEGANRALLFPVDGLVPVPLPELGADDDEEAILLGAVHTPAFEPVVDPDYDRAHLAWAEQTGRSSTDVLGQLGGSPSWIQNDETPSCPSCARTMPLIAQLEEGPDHATAMNFGGCGSAYAFACAPCERAVFLWQC
ncbi:thiol-disulfide isomerase/thioredoxin [Kitasatospora sp. MAP12-15]|uniref:DUF1963 domain-containing protein n=1 Tax=unclassified Kitasatospora TaxID=2633591 RepID=UPI00247448EE|nr:DUF1963 domain-containing protein [Kitasatospora sp. MAP12-44]MDH6111496.1 thiol-disulfide isomerase/thioredoxin [Kitasatospora sp. MAP12-44]